MSEFEIGQRVCVGVGKNVFAGTIVGLGVDYYMGRQLGRSEPYAEVKWDQDGSVTRYPSEQLKPIPTHKATIAALDAEIEELFGRIRDLIGKLA